MNITCSKRCAKPVRPRFSSPEPTWYQTLVVAMGTEWSSCTISVRPLGRVSMVYGTLSLRRLSDGLAGDAEREGETK